MIDYRAGTWGFHVAVGLRGSLAPRALTMAVPNAVVTFLLASWLQGQDAPLFKVSKSYVNSDELKVSGNMYDSAQMVLVAFTTVMIFILHNRSRVSYNRWWEGGTLLQKTRGEWFNAYSSVMAFTSTKPELQDEVCQYVHLLARLMSLLMCCGLQQVSPNRDRPFEILDPGGIEPAAMEFLNAAPDKVEVILQWIQRSMVLHVHTGVLPVAPPILSRAFQEVSRGIVNLQNARKIADFPYPYPLAQISMILQIGHFVMVPFAAALAVPKGWATLFSFCTIFCLWCIHFNALDLEFPFGTRVNDLPMEEMQQDWNKSLCTLIDKRGCRPPDFAYDAVVHGRLDTLMSDQSELYVPVVIRRGGTKREGTSVRTSATACTDSLNVGLAAGRSSSSIDAERRPSMVTVPGRHQSTNAVDKFAGQYKQNSQDSVENHDSAGLETTSAAAERIPDLVTANDRQTSSDDVAPSALQLEVVPLSERNSAILEATNVRNACVDIDI